MLPRNGEPGRCDTATVVGGDGPTDAGGLPSSPPRCAETAARGVGTAAAVGEGAIFTGTGVAISPWPSGTAGPATVMAIDDAARTAGEAETHAVFPPFVAANNEEEGEAPAFFNGTLRYCVGVGMNVEGEGMAVVPPKKPSTPPFDDPKVSPLCIITNKF